MCVKDLFYGFTNSRIQQDVEEDTPFGFFPLGKYLSRFFDKGGKVILRLKSSEKSD